MTSKTKRKPNQGVGKEAEVRVKVGMQMLPERGKASPLGGGMVAVTSWKDIAQDSAANLLLE